MAAFVTATFVRLSRALRRRFGRPAGVPAAEIWCRPATVLALRNRAHATDCVAGWR
jgi:hypothetical protein